MPNRLTNLVIEENTLCHAGANPGARVILFKRRDVGKAEREYERDDAGRFGSGGGGKGGAEVHGQIVAAHERFSGMTHDELKSKIVETEAKAKETGDKNLWRDLHDMQDALSADPHAITVTENHPTLGQRSYTMRAYSRQEADRLAAHAESKGGTAKVVRTKKSTELVQKFIKEEGGKFCVYSEDGAKLGEHDTRVAAEAQLAAVEASKARKSADADDACLVDAVDAVVGKLGAKISAARLARLKDAHGALGAMINEQDSSYHPGGDQKEKDTMPTDAEKKAADEKAALEKKQADDAAAMKKQADEKAASDAKNRTDVEKALDERIAKAVDAAVVPLRKENDDLRKTLDSERERRETIEVEHLVKTDLQGYPGSIEEKVAIVKSIRKSLPEKEAKDAVEKMKAAAATLRKSDTFKEIGTDAAGGAAGGSAEQELQQLAKTRFEEVRKSGDVKMTIEKAYTMVCDANPVLYKRYLEERSAQVSH